MSPQYLVVSMPAGQPEDLRLLSRLTSPGSGCGQGYLLGWHFPHSSLTLDFPVSSIP